MMLLMKTLLFIWIILFGLWTLWGCAMYFKLIEAEQDYNVGFPIVRCCLLIAFVWMGMIL